MIKISVVENIFKEQENTGLSTVTKVSKEADDFYKSKTNEEFLNQFDDPNEISIFGKTADEQFEAHVADNPKYMYAVGEVLDVEGNIQSVRVSAEELKADVANDASIIKRLKDCV